jgi:hypothetical protein
MADEAAAALGATVGVLARAENAAAVALAIILAFLLGRGGSDSVWAVAAAVSALPFWLTTEVEVVVVGALR